MSEIQAKRLEELKIQGRLGVILLIALIKTGRILRRSSIEQCC